MERDEIPGILGEHRRELDEFGVKSLALFGSFGRDEALADSDVDILVEFAVPVGLFEFVRLKAYLEKLLRLPVDLVTPDGIRDGTREQILREAVYATQKLRLRIADILESVARILRYIGCSRLFGVKIAKLIMENYDETNRKSMEVWG